MTKFFLIFLNPNFISFNKVSYIACTIGSLMNFFVHITECVICLSKLLKHKTISDT